MELEQLQFWSRWLELQRDRVMALIEVEEEEAEACRRRKNLVLGEIATHRPPWLEISLKVYNIGHYRVTVPDKYELGFATNVNP